MPEVCSDWHHEMSLTACAPPRRPARLDMSKHPDGGALTRAHYIDKKRHCSTLSDHTKLCT